jgi:hypothetical protein
MSKETEQTNVKNLSELLTRKNVELSLHDAVISCSNVSQVSCRHSLAWIILKNTKSQPKLGAGDVFNCKIDTESTDSDGNRNESADTVLDCLVNKGVCRALKRFVGFIHSVATHIEIQ